MHESQPSQAQGAHSLASENFVADNSIYLPIAPRKGDRSWVLHHISKYVFYDKLSSKIIIYYLFKIYLII